MHVSMDIESTHPLETLHAVALHHEAVAVLQPARQGAGQAGL